MPNQIIYSFHLNLDRKQTEASLTLLPNLINDKLGFRRSNQLCVTMETLPSGKERREKNFLPLFQNIHLPKQPDVIECNIDDELSSCSYANTSDRIVRCWLSILFWSYYISIHEKISLLIQDHVFAHISLSLSPRIDKTKRNFVFRCLDCRIFLLIT